MKTDSHVYTERSRHFLMIRMLVSNLVLLDYLPGSFLLQQFCIPLPMEWRFVVKSLCLCIALMKYNNKNQNEYKENCCYWGMDGQYLPTSLNKCPTNLQKTRKVPIVLEDKVREIWEQRLKLSI